MDYSLMIIIALVVAGVGGFIVLTFTLLNNWKAGSRGHEESDADQSKRSREGFTMVTFVRLPVHDWRALGAGQR